MSQDASTEEKIAACPPQLQDTINQFIDVEPRERLEYLLEYAMDLPDLPERLVAMRDQMEQVHECQTPVFLFTELSDAGVEFYFDIPRESPTVRGYAAILQEGLHHASIAEVLQTPEDVYMLLGLNEAITPQRLRGLHFLMIYMKKQVSKLL
ncbi:MAG: SufE family protein [Caldilineaceae bacterium]